MTAVYVTLARLEDRGYVASTVDGSGRRVLRRYALTSDGARQLLRAKDQLDMLWQDAALHPELGRG